MSYLKSNLCHFSKTLSFYTLRREDSQETNILNIVFINVFMTWTYDVPFYKLQWIVTWRITRTSCCYFLLWQKNYIYIEWKTIEYVNRISNTNQEEEEVLEVKWRVGRGRVRRRNGPIRMKLRRWWRCSWWLKNYINESCMFQKVIFWMALMMFVISVGIPIMMLLLLTASQKVSK
jgi:hypothetical protein